MQIRILSSESLGVRGLSCEVVVESRKVVIDPGLALGYRRFGFLPHPVQVAVGEQVRARIVAALSDATDIVLSHFHGDHIPSPDANPYQLSAQQVAPLLRTARLWSKSPEDLSPHTASRREALIEMLDFDLPEAEGKADGPLEFSPPVSHGDPQTNSGTLMMTRIEDEDGVFVHASDIQLLDSSALEVILDWRPNVVLASGPPLYRATLSGLQRQRAWENGKRLAQSVDTLVLDHHLLRCEAGLQWLKHLALETGRDVLCAADFMGRPRCLLEARRMQLYKKMPIPEGWHEAYARGELDTRNFQDYTGAGDDTFINLAVIRHSAIPKKR